MNLHYREMDVDDLPAAFAVRLSTLENAVTLDELSDDYGITPRSVARAMATTLRGWLAEESGRVVGFAMGDRSNGEVQVVAVLPACEGRGIGRNLLDRVTDWLFAEGFEEVWLRSNPDATTRAHRFYRRLGWTATGSSMGDDEVLVLRRS